MSGPYDHPDDQPGLEVSNPPAQPDHAGYQTPYYEAASKEQPYSSLEVSKEPYSSLEASKEPYSGLEAGTPPSKSNRVCGFPKRTFWIVFAITLVVVGAALGGGLGGGLAGSHQKAHVPATSSSSTGTPQQQQSTGLSSTPTPTSSSATSSTSSSSAASSTISPFSTAPGTYRIINIVTNTAIDLFGGGTANGTQIEAWAWDLNGTPANYAHQAWLMASISSNAVTIYNTASRQYLTAPSDLTSGVDPSDNALAEIYGGGPGSPGDPHTQFTIVKNSDNSISFQSVAYETKVLDVAASGTTNGTPILMWESNGGDNQRWRLLPS